MSGQESKGLFRTADCDGCGKPGALPSVGKGGNERLCPDCLRSYAIETAANTHLAALVELVIEEWVTIWGERFRPYVLSEMYLALDSLRLDAEQRGEKLAP